MPKYKVKSMIQHGERVQSDKPEEGEIEQQVYFPGDEIELEEDAAFEMRHALVDPPEQTKKAAAAPLSASRGADDTRDDLDEGEKEALDSIRRRPDNLESGVMLHWQADPIARAEVERRASGGGRTKTLAVGHGFERANTGHIARTGDQGLNAPLLTRPEANKTEMELEDEKLIEQENERLAKEADKKVTETSKPAPQGAKPPAAAEKK